MISKGNERWIKRLMRMRKLIENGNVILALKFVKILDAIDDRSHGFCLMIIEKDLVKL